MLLWSDEIEGEIFDRIAKGQAVRTICLDDWLPSERAFYNRLASDKEFVQQYAHARERQADAIFEQCLEIADQYEQSAEKQEGGTDHIARAKLRIDTRKWMAGKLRPKVYGDKITAEHTGDPDAPIIIAIQRQIVDPKP